MDQPESYKNYLSLLDCAKLITKTRDLALSSLYDNELSQEVHLILNWIEAIEEELSNPFSTYFENSWIDLYQYFKQLEFLYQDILHQIKASTTTIQRVQIDRLEINQVNEHLNEAYKLFHEILKSGESITDDFFNLTGVTQNIEQDMGSLNSIINSPNPPKNTLKVSRFKYPFINAEDLWLWVNQKATNQIQAKDTTTLNTEKLGVFLRQLIKMIDPNVKPDAKGTAVLTALNNKLPGDQVLSISDKTLSKYLDS